MRPFITLTASLLFISFLGLNAAHAARTGIDERIHICTTDAEAKFLGKNQTFRVHVKADHFINITRLSDKKKAQAKYSNFAYIFDKKTSGAFGRGGYLFDVKDSEMIVSFGVSSGVYESDRLSCVLARQISQLDPMSETEKKLTEIAENANIANGGTDVSKFDLGKFNLKTEQANLAKNKDGWPGCKWQAYTNSATIYKLIEKDAYDPDTAAKLKSLEKTPGFFKMIALISDNEIECSQRYVWAYTSDGYKLELMYSQGD